MELLINSDPIKFKVDTGAAVTAIPAEMSGIFPDIIPSQTILCGAGNCKLKIAKVTEAELCTESRQIKETVYLVEGLVTPLLGKPAISKLELINFV